MASDGETTKDVSSQVTVDPMETSTGSVLGKRGNEDISKDDFEEDEVDGDDDEEEEVDSEYDNWDKDSFDDKVYEHEDDGQCSDEDLQQRIRDYHRTCIETKGFFGPPTKPLRLWSGIANVSEHPDKLLRSVGMTVRKFLGDMAIKCVEKHNIEKGKDVQFVGYVRANFVPGGGTKYYITFNAKESDSPDAPIVEYQPKVIWSAGKTYPILCRPAPP